MSLGELAAAEQVKPPTMVRIVASLGKQGLVRSRADSNDRRRLQISATAKGRRLMMVARKRRIDALARAIADISDSQREALRTGLHVMQQVQRLLRER